MLDEQIVNQKIQQLFNSSKKKIVYPKQQTIQQMIAMMPKPRIQKKVINKEIQEINYNLNDYLAQSSFHKKALLQYSQKLKNTLLPSSLLKQDLVVDNNILHKQRLISGNYINLSVKVLSRRSIQPKEMIFQKIEQSVDIQKNSWFQPLIVNKTSDNLFSHNLCKKQNLTRFKHSFQNDYILNIDSKLTLDDLDQRAKILAKLYINFQKIEVLQKKQQQKIVQKISKKEKERQIPNVQDTQMQIKLNNLIKHVEQKINQKAYTLFRNKQYQQAANYKKKLQNLHWKINNRQNIKQGFQTILLFKSKHNI